MIAPRSRKGSFRRALLSILRLALEAALIFLLISAVIGPFEIQQISMEPNFHAGERVMVSKLGNLWPAWLIDVAHAEDDVWNAPFALQRGQIVVFYTSRDRSEQPLIKRIIGLPGDTLEIRDGKVYLNGALLYEPYVDNAPTICQGGCERIILGANDYFLMGDNRPSSRDSRSFGPINGDQIVGRVIMRYWPLNALTIFR